MAVMGTESLAAALKASAIKGDQLEIQAVIEIADSTEVGFKLRSGDGEQTIVGFDCKKSELFVDRTQSGESTFHERFAVKHSGPLSVDNGTIELRIYVDASSVEVFGGDGETVLTERIFPDPQSTGISVYSNDGNAKFQKLDVWSLKSVWHDN